jgi:hypothetical protein
MTRIGFSAGERTRLLIGWEMLLPVGETWIFSDESSNVKLVVIPTL